jgi:hypothetical protein
MALYSKFILGLYLNADPSAIEPMRIHTDPDPGQTL